MRRVLLLGLGLCVSTGLAGCASSYRTAMREFDQARYPEALADLQQTEGELSSLSERDRARYALYRGLTHLALGDRRATVRWLSSAKRALDTCPDLLSDDDAGRFAAAWSHLRLQAELEQ